MIRSRYSYEYKYIFLCRSKINRALKSKRGQAFLVELAAQMDYMPNRALINSALIEESGGYCAIGVVSKSRNLDVSKIDPYDPKSVGIALKINHMIVAEIAYINDEGVSFEETPQQRWVRVRKWVWDTISREIKPSKTQ